MALAISLPMSRIPFILPYTTTAQTSVGSPHCLELLPHNRVFKRPIHSYPRAFGKGADEGGSRSPRPAPHAPVMTTALSFEVNLDPKGVISVQLTTQTRAAGGEERAAPTSDALHAVR